LTDDRKRALLEQLTAEYSILQGKIDKIGGFRFTIRGWCVTLVAATTASAVAVGSTWTATPYLVPLLAVFIVLFAMLEGTQNGVQLKFGERALRIEKDIHQILGATPDAPPSPVTVVGPDLMPPKRGRGRFDFAPRIAHSMIDVHQRRVRKIQMDRWLQRKWRLDHLLVFYGMQILVVAAVTMILFKFGPQGHPLSSVVPNTTVIEYNTTQPSTLSPQKPNENTKTPKERPAKPRGH
jgi:hypothetical protein